MSDIFESLAQGLQQTGRTFFWMFSLPICIILWTKAIKGVLDFILNTDDVAREIRAFGRMQQPAQNQPNGEDEGEE